MIYLVIVSFSKQLFSISKPRYTLIQVGLYCYNLHCIVFSLYVILYNLLIHLSFQFMNANGKQMFCGPTKGYHDIFMKANLPKEVISMLEFVFSFLDLWTKLYFLQTALILTLTRSCFFSALLFHVGLIMT